MKLKKFNLAFKILFHVTLVIYGLFAAATPIMFANSSLVNSVLGVETEVSSGGGADGTTYFDTKFNSLKEVKEASLKIIEETMSEGAVLVKNNGALPLSRNDEVSLYGIASYYSVHTGQGSSGVEADGANPLADRVTFFDGLTSAGLKVNSDLNDWYKNQGASSVGGNDFIGSSTQESQFVVKDIGWDSIPQNYKKTAKAAVMVLARNSGEAIDLYMDTTMDDNGTRVVVSKDSSNPNSPSSSKGDALELTENEKSVLQGLNELRRSGTVENIVVIMNSASPLQCEFIEDYGIDACLWVGTLGSNGAVAVGKLLTGEYNPSGRLSDTFWANSKYNPVYYNFGAIEYGNSGILTQKYYARNGKQGNQYYVAYQEGIYNGYKYTETRYEDYILGQGNAGEYDYNKVVSYPFGYGLSYSDFTYSNMKVSDDSKKEGTYTVSVDVTNNTDVAGKEAVQIYLQKPYTQYDIDNKVEKSSVELVGFAKVDVPANGKVTAKVTVEEKYFAAYDANNAKTYVIGSADSGDKYLLTAAKDAHDAVNNILRYKGVDESRIINVEGRGKGDSNLVWDKYISFDKDKYSTNEFIKSENEREPAYDGANLNYGVDSITNRMDDVDFKKAGIFSESEANQQYMTRSDWSGTYGKRIILTANAALNTAQTIQPLEKDDIAPPLYEEIGFYESSEVFDEIKLIYLRGRDYNDPVWDTLLDRMSWEETCNILQNGLRVTNSVPSIAAPSTSQQNGAVGPIHSRNWRELIRQSGFTGFAESKDNENKGQLPAVFLCNGTVASTYNTELIQRLGEQTGEEAAWAGYNGIYGLGVNIHRGAYCGRTFEYYSEDGFLTGVSAGYEAVGLHKLGVFVLMKHAALNDQETHRAGVNAWANEQSVREIYLRAMEIAVDIDRQFTPRTVLGVMTGMNCMGAKWTGAQGFCNTVLKAEYGMRGYIISDYSNSRLYMSPVQGVLNGNDLSDGITTGWAGGNDLSGNSAQFKDYEQGYGELAWAMRESAHSILYTVVNSNAMNGVNGDSSFDSLVPAWQIAFPVVTRVMLVLFIWSALGYVAVWTVSLIKERGKKLNVSDAENKSEEIESEKYGTESDNE